MADVFISYSRRDEEFVERLRETLADNGKDVWVDREDIGPAVEWRREIELGIEGADIFTFVITPDALRSEPCRRELEHAVSTQKRIVPLLRHEPDGLPVPEQLGEPQLHLLPHRRGVRARVGGPAGGDRQHPRVGARAHPAARARGGVGAQRA